MPFKLNDKWISLKLRAQKLWSLKKINIPELALEHVLPWVFYLEQSLVKNLEIYLRALLFGWQLALQLDQL